ncbi:MAG: porphobilinogen synthase [Syntrophomonas sp.]|uniref:porphobilinogen synthase n=1 Tax=Syntrophomonas sp. TaxID=2053627 RepID=UPI0026045938|nr:porphobilinogen synthase [Syntrophomonas sp.]MDD2510421.1 porphobilinogen synthase [Syntrophomonas sp.]MDD3878468.1 porphobilinogen synthase [Syntrophomonas sp.]MDD4625882.1 porphobilinogen synthase [Syntrophomonas sp.]
MGFPTKRMRRLRSSETMRRMVRETTLRSSDLIYPLFVIYGQDKKIAVSSMPGVFQFSADRLSEEILEIDSLNIPAVLLFGLPEHKDSVGSSAYQDNGVVQEATRLIKKLCPEMLVITDVCLCEYTDHGHCGLIDQKGVVDNDATLDLLAKEALSHARAGCDIIAPSDMMDGRIGYIRKELDDNGYKHIPIMSYAAKYASSFYGPFRDAADSAPQFGDRKSYQMDGANIREALREVALDIEEGADIVMVKPALPYLDVIKAVKEEFAYPTAAYNVSGEYAMIKAAAACGWLDEERVMMEALTSIKRAGADLIITYFAKDAARVLLEV